MLVRVVREPSASEPPRRQGGPRLTSLSAIPEPDLPDESGAPPFAGDPPQVSPVADASHADSNARPADQTVSGRVQSDVGSNGRNSVRR